MTNGAGTLCQQDVDNLSSDGNLRFDNLDEMLTATGREELLLLARRFRGRFPDFFEPIYNRTDYEVGQSPLASLPVEQFDEFQMMDHLNCLSPVPSS